MGVKASIYCTGCGTRNIVESPIEGMEVVCQQCSKSIILRKKAASANSKRMKTTTQSPPSSGSSSLRSTSTSGSLKKESTRFDSPSMQGTLLDANLKLMERIELLEDKVLDYQAKNGELKTELTELSVSRKEQDADDAGDFPGKGLIEATLLEVKDQKAGQDLYHAMQKKESETLYKTINAVMLEIYEIKKEIERISTETTPS